MSSEDSVAFPPAQLKAIASFVALLQILSGDRKKTHIEEQEVQGLLLVAETLAIDFQGYGEGYKKELVNFCPILIGKCKCNKKFRAILLYKRNRHRTNMQNIWHILNALTDPNFPKTIDFKELIGARMIANVPGERLASEIESIFNSLP